MITDKTKRFGGKWFDYSENHKLGMEVPEGGSSCSNCIFLGIDHKTCKNKEWIKWNSGNNKLPVEDERYCCDLYNWKTK